MADYLDIMTPESQKATDEAINKLDVVDNKIQDICDTMESVSDRARVVNDGQDSAQRIEARVTNGNHISKMSPARVTRVARSSRSSHSRPGLSLFSKSIHPTMRF